jgi:hypothetical protein
VIERIMPTNLLKFLFADSQQEAVIQQMLEDDRELALMLEAAAGEEKLEIKATPLIAALKQVMDIDGELETYTDGVKLKLDNQADYNLWREKLARPDVLAKLAELGWVAFFGGDTNSYDQPANYEVKFLELSTADTDVGKGFKDQAAFDKSMRAAAEKTLSQNAPDPDHTYGPDELPDPETHKKKK